MSKLICGIIATLLLGGCASLDLSRTLHDATIVGTNTVVGVAGGAAAGAVLCRRGDRGCRDSYTGAGAAVGVGVGLSRLAEEERQRRWEAANAPRTDCVARMRVDEQGRRYTTEDCASRESRLGYRNW